MRSNKRIGRTAQSVRASMARARRRKGPTLLRRIHLRGFFAFETTFRKGY